MMSKKNCCLLVKFVIHDFHDEFEIQIHNFRGKMNAEDLNCSICLGIVLQYAHNAGIALMNLVLDDHLTYRVDRL